jgi:hypothetical protein
VGRLVLHFGPSLAPSQCEQPVRIPIATSSIEEYAEGLLCAGPVVLVQLLDAFGVAGRELRLKELRACLGGKAVRVARLGI